MAKARKVFACTNCGSAFSRWMGKCPDCGAWDSLEEQRVEAAATKDPQKGVVEAWQAGMVDADEAGPALAAAPKAVAIAEIGDIDAASPRMATGILELDRVLGGDLEGVSTRGEARRRNLGLVPGSAVLFGGAPGIGKSTLLMQACGAWARSGSRVLYVSSEESGEQVRLRAARLRTDGRPDGPTIAEAEGLFVLADTNLARIVEQARRVTPDVLVIDSIQMIYKADLDAPPGSITQLRRCAQDLIYLAKLSGMAVVLVGHVTKEGQLAGPRLLEHLVDAVLYFEGDRHHAGRIVRAIKNRFGTTLELGIFEMTGAGLAELPGGPSVAALEEARPGAVVCPVMHGSRCVLAELQALTATGFLGSAKRKASGVDSSRLAMLIAVLEQHAELRLADRDIFAQSVGGVKITEPAADLALLLAIAGSHYRRSLEPATVAVGEVGLGGELRPVAHLEQRLREASRLGYKRAIVPLARGRGGPPKIAGLETIEARNADAAIQQLQ